MKHALLAVVAVVSLTQGLPAFQEEAFSGTVALIGHYNGNCAANVDLWIGGDVPAAAVGAVPPPALAYVGLPVSSAIIGTTAVWTLSINHAHGTSGVAVVKVRRSVINGPCVNSPTGTLAEVLISGPLYFSASATHTGQGSTAVWNVVVPNLLTLVGVNWAAQATILGGGVADLSSCLYGVVGSK